MLDARLGLEPRLSPSEGDVLSVAPTGVKNVAPRDMQRLGCKTTQQELNLPPRPMLAEGNGIEPSDRTTGPGVAVLFVALTVPSTW